MNKKTKPDLMSTSEAVNYLRRLHPDLNLTADTFAHRVTRGRGVPHVTREYGLVTRWFFRAEDLDRMKFRRPRKRVTDPQGGDKEITERNVANVPFTVRTASELSKLEEQYGTLVDDAGFLEALYKKTKHRYKPGSLKARRRRNTIKVVAQSSGPHKIHWYPLSQIDELDFHPEIADRQRMRRNKLKP